MEATKTAMWWNESGKGLKGRELTYTGGGRDSLEEVEKTRSVELLEDSLLSVTLKDSKDRWKWLGSSSGVFTVSNFRMV